MSNQNLIIRDLGLIDFQSCWQEMHDFTKKRDGKTTDELWMLQHYPVFTLGQSGKEEHILTRTDIPIVKTDRGGQVTYHGNGQLVGYCLFDIGRMKLPIRRFVTMLERIFINFLKSNNIDAYAKLEAPGVYVDGAKIAFIGLRIHKNRSYHGFAFNVDLDLTPFSDINPCGYKNQPITSLSKLGINLCVEQIQQAIASIICASFNFKASVSAPCS